MVASSGLRAARGTFPINTKGRSSTSQYQISIKVTMGWVPAANSFAWTPQLFDGMTLVSHYCLAMQKAGPSGEKNSFLPLRP